MPRKEILPIRLPYTKKHKNNVNNFSDFCFILLELKCEHLNQIRNNFNAISAIFKMHFMDIVFVIFR